jgi:hypothetical protein
MLYCEKYESVVCPRLFKPPYVCNACSKTYSCLFDKYLYSADHAHREYVEELHESRKGIDLTKDELIELDELVSPLIMKGQPISHIFAEHADEIPCSERTLYNYIEKRYLSVGNLDLRRKVRYKKRKHEEEVKPSPRKKINHHYKDFLCELEENPGVRVVEMDTVIGRIGGKVIMTFDFTFCNFMFGILLENKTAAAAANANRNTKPADVQLAGEFAANKGKLPWPADGPVVEGFGKHNDPVYTQLVMPANNGVNIGLSAGAEVKAVFDGEVKRVIVMPGYGRCVLVQHGGYFTFYCKLGQVGVKSGDKVTTGQVLGRVDTIDGQTELHFEVWKEKTPEDPELWLRKK